jgi:hypothetical protein
MLARWKSREVARNLPSRGRQSGSLARCVSIRFFRRPIRQLFKVPALPLNRVHVPLGTRILTAGCGLAQRWGGPIEEIRPGDVVWFSPGEKHWHGATPATAMTHIAIQEKRDGKVVDWMEQVSDEQYRTR